MSMLPAIAAGLTVLTSSALAQSGVPLDRLQYGENQRGTIKDSDVVSRAFPDVDGIELLAPAFTDPGSSPAGWQNGTDGPTSYTDFGMHSTRDNEGAQS